MQSSQLSGTANVVSKGGIMVEGDLLMYGLLARPQLGQEFERALCLCQT